MLCVKCWKSFRVDYTQLIPNMVWSDYYNHTIFESLVIERAVRLAQSGWSLRWFAAYFGGPETAGFGFGLGVERSLLILEKARCGPSIGKRPRCLYRSLGWRSKRQGLELVQFFRQQGFKAGVITLIGKLKAQFKSADVLLLSSQYLGRAKSESG